MPALIDSRPIHILLVEDDPAVATSLRSGLEREGYAVTWADSGAAGVAYARDRDPHLVLLDVRLPDSSGFDVCRQVRQLGLRQPIVMLTARREEIDRVLGLEMGADDYVTKPFSLRELLARIRAHLRRRDEFGVLARSFDSMAERVEGTVSTLRRFVADAAHELHTPLTALRIHLEMAPGDEHVTRAQVQVARLEALTAGLLSLSRIEAEKHVPPSVPIALDALVQAVAELYASQAEQAGLDFDLHVAERPIVVLADEGHVRDVLGNLLDNACKFTPEGGAVHASLYREGEWAVICVEDTGIGIPPEDMPRLFKRFHRGRNAVGYPGSGLGLAIVQAIVERYGGTVEAQLVDQGGPVYVATAPAIDSLTPCAVQTLCETRS